MVRHHVQTMLELLDAGQAHLPVLPTDPPQATRPGQPKPQEGFEDRMMAVGCMMTA